MKPTLRELTLLLHERDKALKLQHKEYTRRLEILNHQSETLTSIQAKYVPREVYERDINASDQRVQFEVNNLNEKRDMVYKELTTKIELLGTWKAAMDGQGQLTKYVPWVLTAISILLMYLNKHS